MSSETEQRLSEIRGRLGAILGEPWRASPCSSGGIILERGPEQPIAERHRQQFLQIVPEADGDFVAHAPDDIRFLLDLVRDLKG